MTIKEVSEKYDISADTIRYYERIGLLPPIPRKSNGIRDFDEVSCNWIEFVKCMRSAGVEIEALIDYIKLFYQEGTAEARKEILKEQRDRLQKKIDVMNLVIERLNKKVDRYEEIIIPAEKKLKEQTIKTNDNIDC
ncbi:MerR family transcriptional regulator [Megamonas hypermegale]|uniref:HTH-type transcriptional regulator AdhR n=2 Tax=Megamonas hypermegale TaxID=158847 RepID=A0A239TLC2_9FIRM|nr:MerR family transcriptional regulator [Megamonas hypermegale]MBM6834104.1 MerR family transcriptional regulator [Megamonas hypermegale]SNU97403.1 HTH-type transcriptional regulator AdhR [Megamonas hypermegale]